MTVTINGTTGIAGTNGSAGTPAVQGEDTNTGIFFPAADTIAFAEGGVERMRIDSSGNVLVGKTSADSGATAGIQLEPDGLAFFTRTSTAAAFNRLSTDGAIVSFRKDGTTLGSIQAFNGALTIAGITATGPQVKIMNNTTSVLTLGAYASASQYGYIGDESGGAVGVAFVNVGVLPVTSSDGAPSDNTFDIGNLSIRWDDIYATNGTIQTSDRNEKQDIEELNDAERRVAVACKGLLRKYRWKDAVAEKGDEARIHFGIIAQDLQAAFAAEGLDAGRYAMFISSTWWEHDGKIYDTAEEAPEGATERTRLGVRYPELLAFMIAVL